MRRGEALQAEWSWINGDFLCVPGFLTKTQTKRLIPITNELRALLGDLPKRKVRLFPGLTDAVTKRFRKAVILAGIGRPLHLHNLRDTFIVQALVAGVPAFMVAKICGNSVRVIEEHYSQFGSEEFSVALKHLNDSSMSSRGTDMAQGLLKQGKI